jgi:hypothetical protein
MHGKRQARFLNPELREWLEAAAVALAVAALIALMCRAGFCVERAVLP